MNILQHGVTSLPIRKADPRIYDAVVLTTGGAVVDVPIDYENRPLYPNTLTISGTTSVTAAGTFTFTNNLNPDLFTETVSSVTWENATKVDNNTATLTISELPPAAQNINVTCTVTFAKGYTMTATKAVAVDECPYVEIAGIKWAKKNIGANSVTDYGLYFQWGDTQGYTADQVGSDSGKKAFDWSDYKYGNGTSSPGTTGMSKYNATDGKTVLDLEDDAVRANWGGAWRMPTTEELQALGNAVNAVWTTDYNGSGVNGLLCTDKTDSSKTLFFPAAGFADNGSMILVGDGGYVWSSSLYSDNVYGAWSLFFDDGVTYWGENNSRFSGYSVRAVLD